MTTQQQPSLRRSIKGLTKHPQVVLAILLPALLGTVLGNWFVIFGIGWEFPFWQIVFTIFFYSRMALAWHRFVMLGERPALRGKPGPSGLRKVYLIRITVCVLMSVFAATVFMALVFEPMFDALPPSLMDQGAIGRTAMTALFMWIMFTMICASILMIGPELPLRAAGQGSVDNAPMKNAVILFGSFLFSPIGMLKWFQPKQQDRSILSELGLRDGIGKPIDPIAIARLAPVMGLYGAAVWTGLGGLLALLGMIPAIGPALSGEMVETVLMQALFGFGALVLASLLAQHALATPSGDTTTTSQTPEHGMDMQPIDTAGRYNEAAPGQSGWEPVAVPPVANSEHRPRPTRMKAEQPRAPLHDEDALKAIFRSEPSAVASTGPAQGPGGGLLSRILSR